MVFAVCRYDLGVTGGVTSMLPFLLKFFPDVYAKQVATAAEYTGSVYCKFDDAKLQIFTSSLFLAGAYVTSQCCRPVRLCCLPRNFEFG